MKTPKKTPPPFCWEHADSLTRRHFLKYGTTGAIASLLPPSLLSLVMRERVARGESALKLAFMVSMNLNGGPAYWTQFAPLGPDGSVLQYPSLGNPSGVQTVQVVQGCPLIKDSIMAKALAALPPEVLADVGVSASASFGLSDSDLYNGASSSNLMAGTALAASVLNPSSFPLALGVNGATGGGQTLTSLGKPFLVNSLDDLKNMFQPPVPVDTLGPILQSVLDMTGSELAAFKDKVNGSALVGKFQSGLQSNLSSLTSTPNVDPTTDSRMAAWNLAGKSSTDLDMVTAGALRTMLLGGMVPPVLGINVTGGDYHGQGMAAHNDYWTKTAALVTKLLTTFHAFGATAIVHMWSPGGMNFVDNLGGTGDEGGRGANITFVHHQGSISMPNGPGNAICFLDPKLNGMANPNQAFSGENSTEATLAMYGALLGASPSQVAQFMKTQVSASALDLAMNHFVLG